MLILTCVFRGPLVKTPGRSQVSFGRRGSKPAGGNFFLFIIILPFVTFFPILLSLLSLNLYQTVRHSPGERSRDIPPDDPRGYFVALWAHLRVIRMRMGEWCFASEFPYRGHPIV